LDEPERPKSSDADAAFCAQVAKNGKSLKTAGR
jgi:hypothetical protein